MVDHISDVFVLCFFFKQKTAYEMRISDWSSDVCSSDLRCWRAEARRQSHPGRTASGTPGPVRSWRSRSRIGWSGVRAIARALSPAASSRDSVAGPAPRRQRQRRRARATDPPTGSRSEEHTSELQSLMRISYAVFCEKKKTTTLIPDNHTSHDTRTT